MKVKMYKAFALSVLLLTMYHQICGMEDGLISLSGDNGMVYGKKTVLKEFEVGTKMGGVVTRIFCLDSKQQINAIDLNGIANVAFYQVGSDEEESVLIKTEENSIDQLQVAIIDTHTLSIGQKSNDFIQPSKGILYCIALKNIHHISCAGSIKMLSLTSIRTDELWLTLQGKSKFIADGPYGIDTNLLGATLRNTASVSLSGKARHQKLYVYDSAEYDAQALETNTVSVEAGGASKIKVSMVDLSAGVNTLDISGIYGSMTELSLLEYEGTPLTRVKCKDSSLLKQIIQEK